MERAGPVEPRSADGPLASESGVRGSLRRLVGWLERWDAELLDFLYPSVCLACEAIQEVAQRWILLCRRCRRDLAPPDGVWCPKCGLLQRATWSGRRCGECRARRWTWRLDSVRPLGRYESLARQCVLQMKQVGGQTLAVHVGRLLGHRLNQRPAASAPPDLVAPIPKHWLRRLRSGTNSAECLVEGVSAVMRIPAAAGLLRFRRVTRKQSLLDQHQRRRNLRGALSVRGSYDIAGKRILIVDDLMTTGATANEAARVLRRAGAAAVDMAVVCRAC